MLAQSSMVDDLGNREVSGSEHLKNDHYTANIREDSDMVTDVPVTVIDEHRSGGKVCVEIMP